MHIQLMSDIHFEFHRDGGEGFLKSVEPKADVLVLAGDLITAKMFNDQINMIFGSFCSRWKHVLFVPGNHEYYAAKSAELTHKAIDQFPELLGLPNLYVLGPWKKYKTEDMPEWAKGHLFIGDRRFIGATMWFPEPPPKVNKRGLTDYASIKEFEPWVYEQHSVATNYLKQTIDQGDIVITHHLPSVQSVPAPFKGSDLNHFFVHDMEKLILERKPAAWLHGHTHTVTQYKIGETVVACNPLGYPREQSGFREDFVVEV